ncbi:MAG: hypothetical protein WDZ31_08535 [Phycisphaeraceae bacterium]
MLLLLAVRGFPVGAAACAAEPGIVAETALIFKKRGASRLILFLWHKQ